MSEGKLRSGISMQYGKKDTAGSQTLESVWFNFTVLDGGEVQIRTSKETIIMSPGAFMALMHLFSQATQSLTWTDPERLVNIQAKDNSKVFEDLFKELTAKTGGMSYIDNGIGHKRYLMIPADQLL